MLLFYHNVLHLSNAFSNKFQIFHPFFLLYLFFFQFSGANPLFSPLKWMQKLGLSHNYFSVLYIKTKLIIPFLSPEVNLFFVKFEFQLRIRFLLQFLCSSRNSFFSFSNSTFNSATVFPAYRFLGILCLHHHFLGNDIFHYHPFYFTSLSSIMVLLPKS